MSVTFTNRIDCDGLLTFTIKLKSRIWFIGCCFLPARSNDTTTKLLMYNLRQYNKLTQPEYVYSNHKDLSYRLYKIIITLAKRTSYFDY